MECELDQDSAIDHDKTQDELMTTGDDEPRFCLHRSHDKLGNYQSGHCLHLSVVSQHMRRQGL